MSRKKPLVETETPEIVVPDCSGFAIEDAFMTLGKLARARHEGRLSGDVEEGAEIANQDVSFELVTREMPVLKTYWEMARRQRAELMRAEIIQKQNELALVEGTERY